MQDKRYQDKIEKLRDPERVARFELERVVALCLDGLKAKSVLDIGTGSGLFVEAFYKQGLEVTGTDVNPEMLAAAKMYVPGARFETAAAEAQPFEDGFFDVVFMACVLHEVEDPAKSLAEAKRVAAMRVAILEYPYREQPFGPPMNHRLKPEQITDAAAQAGINSVKVVELTHVNLYLMEVSP
jgi:ubiquinone/menaquinone biosynthesis C-methylase UbiE